jgi:hypothetical protein
MTVPAGRVLIEGRLIEEEKTQKRTMDRLLTHLRRHPRNGHGERPSDMAKTIVAR